jgi:hypothetical protein
MFDDLFEKLVEQEKNTTDWDYSFRYTHNQIWNNPIEDREGDPVIWHVRPSILQGKRIRVFTDYQANWAKRNGAIPVRE